MKKVYKKIVSQKIAEDFLSPFKNQHISHLWHGAGSAIFLELGDLTDIGKKHPKGELGISIEWSWRIESSSNILLGTFSEDEEIFNISKLLLGKKLIQTSFFARIKEIQIELSDNTWLSSFSTTDGDPQWSARNRAGEYLYFQKGKFIIES